MSKWAPEQLSRSKQTPISISSHLKFDQDLTTLNSALQEAHRVRRVGLHVASSSTFPSLHRTLERTLPVLECLSIEIDKWINTLPQNLILGDAPQLAYLELKHCTPFQTPGPYHNLTELSLDGVGTRWQSEAHFSSVMASMPKLQLLSLTRAIPQIVHPDAGHAPPLALLCLHTITIIDDAPKIQWLWNRIVVPSSTRTFIHRSFSVSLENPASTSLRDYLPAAGTDPQNPLPLRTISINCFLPNAWSVKGWTSTIIHRPQAWTGRSAVHFDDHFEGEDNLFHLQSSTIGTGPSTVVTAVEAVIHALHVESVTAVHLEDSLPPHDVRVTWDTSFVHFRSVRYLSCQGRNARPAILALQMEIGVTETEGSAANTESNAPVRWKIFPSLQHLSLSNANLSQEIPRRGQYAFATLVDVVKHRANGGDGDDRLRTVEIKNCRIASARIAEIEACGVVVDWDGEEKITWPSTPESGQLAHTNHFALGFPQPGNAVAFNPVAPNFNANFVNLLHNLLTGDVPGPQPMDLPVLDDNADEAGAPDDVNMDDPDILDNAAFDEDAFSGVVW
ncbi:hypothetical protein OF83DRAFT_1087714 [Amylostereum chailletii]|nr:hypothetical protein OF83DRAFT_1087714 [Amylostereum chailletii]